jgi:selenocysteine lyase/cysteine desulfurase
MASGGGFYANRCIEAQGVDPQHGVFRASFVHYTAPEDVTNLIRALDEVL